MDHHGETTPAGRSCKSSKDLLVQIGGPPVYWKSVDELQNGPRVTGEFPGGLPGGATSGPRAETTRRDFLALMGFSLAAAGLSGCRAPVQHAVPLLVGSDQIVPGVSNYYATTCRGCASSCSLLVKQRDGRPIKIDGNAESSLFGGGTCAGGQATVLSLYDDGRLKGPLWQGKSATWNEIDGHILQALNDAQTAQKSVVLLSGTMTSPSTRAIVAEWGRSNPRFRHVEYDPVSLSAMRQANKESFGQAAVPHYSFDKAKVIVGLDADFLGTWLSPVEFARQYASSRKPEKNAALHIQFEPGMSVTGSNADVRVPVAPSQLGATAIALLRRIAHKAGTSGPDQSADPVDSARLDAVAEALWKHRGESLVVSGSNEVAVQMVVNAINALLGNIGKTIDLARPSRQRNGDDAAVAQLVEEMALGHVGVLVLYGVNPVYDYPDSQAFAAGLKKVALSVSLNDRSDETGALVNAICPDHHFLEAWGDAEPVESNFSLAQPLIAPLFETRAAQDSLLRWMGREGEQSNYYTYLREYWRKDIFPRQKELPSFEVFWDQSLQRGVVTLASAGGAAPGPIHGGWQEAANKITQSAKAAPQGNSNSYELHFYESVALRDGRQANNPWLQELPDPISKVTWSNYAAIAPALAAQLKLENGDVVALKAGEKQVELPVFIQPGQEGRTISIALGYGRTAAGKVAENVGVNVFPLTALAAGQRRLSAVNASLASTGGKKPLASTQTHFSMEGRPIVLETSLDELEKESEKPEALPTLWAERLQGEHSWGMAIDMNACNGCSACVIACQAENNVPVVGKDQIERIRIMHWIRIDQYYSGPAENPVSVHQPMMCQHCQNAPCETVCPVLATTTSSEGLNAQVYNRCIGTRYCANNCPYKVRRFNWYNYTDNPKFDFNMESPLGRMVLNPDVVVRSRGVMEKCSMCVQRIQLGKNLALQGGRPLADGDIQTACQQSCPTQAIVFGDLKDPNSRVSQLQRSQRNYQVLEDLGTRPNVGYLKKVRNPMERS
ncbi:MAG TPA: TAT-variant-translocated molybdopterin oxidoreductase [Candidatus Saccharimonadales bacterium]|jgi:MoCo/4Fe-4S cofactor protein with predicted Tat translocation signal|nr:TAT-variant-translocated molybdopterin oxidoreductase [Candidatus Saccharimonadales bacterium]